MPVLTFWHDNCNRYSANLNSFSSNPAGRFSDPPEREVMTMVEFLGVALFVLLMAPYLRESKFKELERHQAMRRAMLRLREKYRRFSF